MIDTEKNYEEEEEEESYTRNQFQREEKIMLWLTTQLH